jgi:hypothetical protein
VTLPSGRFKLLTSPAWTGSRPVSKTTGIVVVAAFAASPAAALPGAAITVTRRRTRSGCQCWQSVGLTISPNKFDCDIATLVKAHRAEALAECGQTGRISIGIFTTQISDNRHRLLCAHTNGPNRRAPDQSDEIAPPHRRPLRTRHRTNPDLYSKRGRARPMSALGQKQTCAAQNGMSA